MLRRDMLKLTGTTVAIGAMSLGVVACGGSSGGSGGSGGSGSTTLRMGLMVAPTTFDPAGAEWGNRLPYYQAPYDTLLLAATSGEIEPYLATEWSYDESETELTLTLRDDVTFADDSPLTADAVVTSMTRFKDGSGPDANYLASVDTVTAADDHTVVITLTQPDPALLNYLTRTAGLVLNPAAAENEDLATNPAGSGPYVLDTSATITNNIYVFTKREGYWNPDVQHYDRLEMRFIEDTTAMVNALQAKELDYAKLANAETFAQAESSGAVLHSNELDFQGLLLLDRAGTMVEALGDVRVRQAIAHAMDREALLEAVALGFGTVTGQVFPTGSEAYDEALDERYPYDVEKAKALLAEAGYADGFAVEMPTAASFQTAANLIAQYLSDIGITANYVQPGNNFIADMLAPKFGMTFMALEQNPDWQLANFMISPTATFNPFGYQDPEVDALLEEYLTGDETTRGATMKALNTYIVEQAWFVPFYRAQGSVATNDGTTVTAMLPSNTLPNIYDVTPA